MPSSEDELYSALMRCAADRGFARALWVVLDAAKLNERESRSTEFHTSYRLCANLIEAAAITVSDL
jgi:hypothetical protein